jgi:hypothetical protein
MFQPGCNTHATSFGRGSQQANHSPHLGVASALRAAQRQCPMSPTCPASPQGCRAATLSAAVQQEGGGCSSSPAPWCLAGGSPHSIACWGPSRPATPPAAGNSWAGITPTHSAPHSWLAGPKARLQLPPAQHLGCASATHRWPHALVYLLHTSGAPVLGPQPRLTHVLYTAAALLGGQHSMLNTASRLVRPSGACPAICLHPPAAPQVQLKALACPLVPVSTLVWHKEGATGSYTTTSPTHCTKRHSQTRRGLLAGSRGCRGAHAHSSAPGHLASHLSRGRDGTQRSPPPANCSCHSCHSCCCCCCCCCQ